MTLDKKKLAAAASTTFTLADYVIPSGTRHLAIIFNGALTSAAGTLLVRFNGDTGNNYNFQTLQGAVSTASAARTTGGSSITAFGLPTGTNLFGGGVIVIPHYANTANHKAVLTHGGEIENSVMVHAGRWANTGAITSITLLASANNIAANSIALLCAVDERYLVEESNLSADGTVTFSSIPQLDGDLVVVGYCRTDRAAFADDIDISINADTTDANYARQEISAATTSVAATAPADRILGPTVGDTGTANAFGAFVVSISQHANGVEQPHILAVSGYHESSNPFSHIVVFSGRRANIAAVTSLSFTPGGGGTNFKSGSLFSLYFVPKRLIGYEKLTADKATITHTVPAGYEALVETVFSRSTTVTAQEAVAVAFNNDTTAANYDVQALTGDGSTVSAAQSAANRDVLNVPGASAAANVFAGGQVLIPSYIETDRHKHFLAIHGPADDLVQIRSLRWENTAAITEIDWTATGDFEGN